MTGTELIDRLLQSGTPPDSLEVAKAWSLRQQGGGTAEEVLLMLESDPRVNVGTLNKAKGMVGYVDNPATRGFPVRAPAGGAKVGGRDYGAGEVIPTEALTGATSDERDLLRQTGGTPGAPAARSAIPPLKSTPVTSAPAGEPPGGDNEQGGSPAGATGPDKPPTDKGAKKH